MKPLPLIVIVAALAGVAIVLYYSTRKPTVSAEVREMGKDIKRGTRDAYNGTKDAAEDAKDAVKDAVK